ncbi:MAG: DUF899 family protein [Nitrososphaeraceae archaeon]
MTDHKIGTREEWLAARLELLKAEKALTRRSDELAKRDVFRDFTKQQGLF